VINFLGGDVIHDHLDGSVFDVRRQAVLGPPEQFVKEYPPLRLHIAQFPQMLVCALKDFLDVRDVLGFEHEVKQPVDVIRAG
jgi:hypothetical protein